MTTAQNSPFEDYIISKDTKIAGLEKHLADEKENAALLVVAVSSIQDELKAAQVAAQLAATHREALEQVVREYQQIDNRDIVKQWGYGNCVCSNCKRANELLGEVTV